MKTTCLARYLAILAATGALLIGVSACALNNPPQTTTTVTITEPATSQPTSPVDSTETPSIEPEPGAPSIGGFTLGLSPEELLTMLQQQNISLMTGATGDPKAAPAHPVKDGRYYTFLANGDKGYIFPTAPLSFTFDSSDKLVVIYLQSSGYPTNNGLQVGDTTGRMKQLYGTDYTFSDDLGSGNEVAYMYQLSDGSFFDVGATSQSTTGDNDDAVITDMRLSSLTGQEGD